jgi:hypothetical protein
MSTAVSRTISAISTAWAWCTVMSRANPASADPSPGGRHQQVQGRNSDENGDDEQQRVDDVPLSHRDRPPGGPPLQPEEPFAFIIATP